MLLESIGNTSCRTTMIAHVSPSLPFYTETLATVQLASRLHRLRKRKGKVRLNYSFFRLNDMCSFHLDWENFPVKVICVLSLLERKTFKLNCWGNYFRTIHGDKTLFWRFFPSMTKHWEINVIIEKLLLSNANRTRNIIPIVYLF